jgi:heptosyltransferase-2
VVAIFGPTNHQAWGPWDKSQISNFKCQVVRVELACSPCFYRRFDLGTPQGCAGRDCLARITPEMVIDAVETLGVFS